MNQTLNKGVNSFIFHLLGSIAGISIQILAAKVLGAEEYGKANYLLGLILTYNIFYLFGIQYYLPIQFQKKNSQKKVFSNVLITTFISFLLTIPILYFIEKDRLVTSDFVLVLALIWSFVLLEFIRTYYISKSQADKSTLYTVFLFKILNLVLLASFFLIDWKNYLAFLISILFSQIILFSILFKGKFELVKPDFSYFKVVFIFYFIQLFNFFLFHYSKVIQGDLIDNRAVALLSIALVIGQSLNMISMNFANVLLPVFSQASLKNDIESIKNNFMKMTKVNSYLSLPLLIFIYYFATDILLLLGPDYAEGNIILILIVFGNFFGSFVGPNGTLLLMTGNEKIELYNGFFKLFFGLIIIYFFGNQLWGVALGLMFSEIFVNILKGIEVFILYKVFPYTKKIFFYIITIFIVEFIFLGLIYNLSFSQNTKIIIGLIFILMSCLITFKLSPFRDDREILSNYLNKINGKSN